MRSRGEIRERTWNNNLLFYSRMEGEGSVCPPYQQARKQGSVPFLWEEKPGTPKRKCMLERVQASSTLPPPVKLVTSVPFQWEEKPGKPLDCFKDSRKDSPLLPLPPARLINLHLPLLDPPSASLQTTYIEQNSLFWRKKDDDYGSNNKDEEEETMGGDDDVEDIFDMSYEAFSSDEDEPFRGSPSLLANALIPSSLISNATPASENSVKDYSSVAESLASPNSITDSTTSSYATGTIISMDSFIFLDGLFPSFSPNSSFLDKVGCQERRLYPLPPPPQMKELGYKGNCDTIVRRTPTLGELIRMSYRRKSIHIPKRSPHPDFMKKKMLGCCIF